jgi:hypothetical protein
MIATGTGLALAAGMSGAGSLFGAMKQSSAAKKAAQQQEQAAQAASAMYRQGLGQLGQMYAPYINSGASVMNTLGRLTTPGPGARYASPGPPDTMPRVPQGGGAMPTGGQQGPFQMMAQGGRPMQGPYMMADGGDFMVNQPTMFIAGEAGPERASFSGGGPMPMGGGGPMPMNGGGGMPMSGMGPMPMSGGGPVDLTGRGMSGRAGAMQGGMRGGPQAAGANAMRGPFGGMYGG